MTEFANRVAVIGDLGGHATVLQSMLDELGVEFEISANAHHLEGRDWGRIAFDWPADLQIVQVGDLVHRGPDSLGIVMLVDRLIERGVWTQIVGNHEQLYVDRPVFHWNEEIDPAAQTVLREWWSDGRMVPGAVLEKPTGDNWLITHGGLTSGFWEHGLGGPTSAIQVLDPLWEARRDGALWHPGAMLTGSADRNAGPVWAESGTEVYPSWAAASAPMPFNQAHGHSSSYDWDRQAWRAESWVRALIHLDHGYRHATLTLGGRRIVGIDPGHGAEVAPGFAPMIVRNAVVRVR